MQKENQADLENDVPNFRLHIWHRIVNVAQEKAQFSSFSIEAIPKNFESKKELSMW